MFQWLSPSFPTGSFNFSQGLEYAVSQSMVKNEADLVVWIENNLEHRCNGELSLHVLDIIDSTMRASQTGVPQEIKTTCKKPKPFTLEEIKKILN